MYVTTLATDFAADSPLAIINLRPSLSLLGIQIHTTFYMDELIRKRTDIANKHPLSQALTTNITVEVGHNPLRSIPRLHCRIAVLGTGLNYRLGMTRMYIRATNEGPAVVFGPYYGGNGGTGVPPSSATVDVIVLFDSFISPELIERGDTRWGRYGTPNTGDYMPRINVAEYLHRALSRPNPARVVSSGWSDELMQTASLPVVSTYEILLHQSFYAPFVSRMTFMWASLANSATAPGHRPGTDYWHWSGYALESGTYVSACTSRNASRGSADVGVGSPIVGVGSPIVGVNGSFIGISSPVARVCVSREYSIGPHRPACCGH